MQQVGKQWQNLDDKGKKYFQQKADNDKFRYLEETRKFHDEVAKIGDSENKTQSGDGGKQGMVGRKRGPDQGTNQLMADALGIGNLRGDQDSMASKRMRFDSRISNLTDGGSYLGDSADVDPTRPRKPLSAFIFFSQEFKAVLKQ